MKQYVINQFHFHGTFVAGDNFDIHDNPFSTFCQGQHPIPYDNTPTIEDITPVNISDEVSSYALSEFKYIHVAVTDTGEREQIHKTICNIVRLPKMQQICDELYRLMKEKKVLCSINPDAMLTELRRLGMPAEGKDGFSQKNFKHYYRTPKID